MTDKDRYVPLVLHAATQAASRFGGTAHDWQGEVWLLFEKALPRWKPEKGTLSSYFLSYVCRELSRSPLRARSWYQQGTKSCRKRKYFDLCDVYHTKRAERWRLPDRRVSERVDRFLDLCNDQQKQIAFMLMRGMSQPHIGASFNRTQQWAHLQIKLMRELFRAADAA